jgi:hypothetical protein
MVSGLAFYLALALIAIITMCCFKAYAKTDEDVWWVWGFWFVYTLLFTISVAVIFIEVAGELKKSDTYGPNFLKSMLCITPALLVLLLQLVISPSYRKPVLSLSIIAALNIYDGIEMLEIVLMQNEREDFNLDYTVEKAIIVFACLSFVFTSLGLTRHKFDNYDKVEERDSGIVAFLRLLEILCTNVPFLVLRIIVWVDCGYEASIFIAKNIVSLVMGLVAFCLYCECCTCE